MRKDQAKKMIGKQVYAWTASNGEYTGILEDVITVPRRPWRGKIRINGIVRVATPWQVGVGNRRGRRVGDVIEVGGVNIRLEDKQGNDEKTAIAKEIELVKNATKHNKEVWWATPTLTALTAWQSELEDHFPLVYAVFDNGDIEINRWNSVQQFLRSVQNDQAMLGKTCVWAAEIDWKFDGSIGYAAINIVIGNDMSIHYENAKSYAQENLAYDLENRDESSMA